MPLNNNDQLYPILATIDPNDLVAIIPAGSFARATDGPWYARASALAPGVQSITAGTGLEATPDPITNVGIIEDADTGVAAAVYGDAQNVAQFAVNGQGRITAAVNVPISPNGDVFGPAASVNGNFALFNGLTGKLLKDTGLVPGALAVLSIVDLAHLDQSTFAPGMMNGTFVESHAASAATFALKTYAGTDPTAADPVKFVFRSATPGSGAVSVLSIGGALSVTLSSGSTLGASNGVPFKLWLVAFNDAGAVRLGLINSLSGTNIYPVGKFPIGSSTAEGGAGGADSAQVFYTGVAVAAKSYIVLGYASYESGLAAAGTWDASPTILQRYVPNIPLPGDVIQTTRTSTGATANAATTIPLDDTIPQITEGTEYMTQAITPVSATSLLAVDATGYFGCASGSDTQAALFRDATANALVASTLNQASGVISGIAVDHQVLAGSVSSTTFRYRVGSNSGVALTFNGNGSARLLGGVMNSFIEAKEIAT